MPVCIVTSFTTSLLIQHRDGKNSGAHIEMPGCACLVCTVPIQFKMK